VEQQADVPDLIMPFSFNEEIALADIAIEVWADSIENLFHDSALATTEVMVDAKTVEQKIQRELKLESTEIDMLLYDFLSEIIFFKDAESLLFSEFEIKLYKEDKYKLDSKLLGEKINRDKHSLRSDVKAVTLYRFKVWEEMVNKKTLWKATFVLDI
jgi:SHS2 domain-containing protein